MSEIDELSVTFEENGVEVVKELDKVVLTKGAWATVVFLYQDWDNEAEGYGAPKVTLRRYRKVRGQYRQQSKFNLSSLAQGEQLAGILLGWARDKK